MHDDHDTQDDPENRQGSVGFGTGPGAAPFNLACCGCRLGEPQILPADSSGTYGMDDRQSDKWKSWVKARKSGNISLDFCDLVVSLTHWPGAYFVNCFNACIQNDTFPKEGYKMKKLLTIAILAIGLSGALPATQAKAQEPFLGQITYFGGNFAPRGWAFCDGQLLAISQYSALFSLLGTTYGGDGRTTFGLPDLRGRTAIHRGQGPGLSPRTLGAALGTETTTMTTATMPAHNHTGQIKGTTAAAGDTNVNGNMLASGGSYSGRASLDATMAAGTVVTDNAGGNQPINNMQPSLAVNCIIALEGIYPSRS